MKQLLKLIIVVLLIADIGSVALPLFRQGCRKQFVMRERNAGGDTKDEAKSCIPSTIVLAVNNEALTEFSVTESFKTIFNHYKSDGLSAPYISGVDIPPRHV